MESILNFVGDLSYLVNSQIQALLLEHVFNAVCLAE